MAHRKAPPGTYKVRDHLGTYRTIEIDNLLVTARHAALGRFVEQPTLSTPGDTTRYLEAALGHLEHERFCAIWLDNRHRVIRFDELSRGTIDGASVYPREVVKAALSVNAAACIFRAQPSERNFRTVASRRTNHSSPARCAGTRRYPRPRSHRDRTDLRVIRGTRASVARFGGAGACAGAVLFTQQRALAD